MNKIKAAIIEDEVPAARLLHEMIQSLRPDWEVMILPGTIEESVEWFRVNPHPELLFLDIQLTDGNSFMLIEQARPDSMIVFTTAYDEYAVRAFAVNSIDYLLKPIHQERLLQTIERFESLTEKYIRDFNRESRILEVLERLKEDTAMAEYEVDKDLLKSAKLYQSVVLTGMEKVRVSADAAESLIPDSILPYPTYGKLLFSISD